ncbi:MAG: hypothetical protein LBF93_06445 [Zoogloeaceae bacterium]|nr:hypothetical protein [Zoogloeaceae bacterium]
MTLRSLVFWRVRFRVKFRQQELQGVEGKGEARGRGMSGARDKPCFDQAREQGARGASAASSPA